jgi:predicted O-methyltransferase YrrM
MNIDAFLGKLPTAFAMWQTVFAYPRDARRYSAVLDDVQAMTTPSVMHLLNVAVSCMGAGECYLEAGTWRGATFIGAMLDQDAHGYAIDDDSMDNHDKDARRSADVWQENVERFGVAPRAHYINGRIPEVYAGLTLPPIGVYFFDGDKATPEAAWEGIAGALPLLAKRALIILDDANELQVRLASLELQRRHPHNATLLMDAPTPSNCWPGFWNGFHMLAWVVGDA